MFIKNFTRISGGIGLPDYVKAFESYRLTDMAYRLQTDIQTLCTKPPRGWSKKRTSSANGKLPDIQCSCWRSGTVGPPCDMRTYHSN